MNTNAELQLAPSSYSAQQDIGTIQQQIEIKESHAGAEGRLYLLRIIGPWISEEDKRQSSFGVFWPSIEKQEEEILKEKKSIEIIDWRAKQIKLIQQAKQWHELHKEKILDKYEGKHIAIILNPTKGLRTPFKRAVVGTAKDFHSLSEKVYKRYGYKAIYMPFIKRGSIYRTIQVPSVFRLNEK